MKAHAPAERQLEDTEVQHAAGGEARGARLHIPPYETVALVLQGGGALGAYQAGVFEGLHESGVAPNWLAGISIGALNTAIIAGNRPEERLEKLREFWETICRPAYVPILPANLEHMIFHSHEHLRQMLTGMQASGAVMQGQQGFFVPRVPSMFPWLDKEPGKACLYDTSQLKSTLLRLCDFGRINSGEVRVSVGAVNVETGNFAYFDNTKTVLRPEHFMASGALPPAFAPVEIDGQYFWDGGVVSNTPLQEVLKATPLKDSLVFQVDLWSARGPVPRDLTEVAARLKDVQYSSRTRFVTDMLHRNQRFRNVLKHVLENVPEQVRKADPWCQAAEELAGSKRYNVLHLIYKQKPYDAHYKDYQFGISTMRDHWASGLRDIRQTLVQDGWLDMPVNESGFVTHDIHRVR
jgi:NTE family protein